MAKKTIEVKKFPFFRQLDSMDCGPTCLRMVAKYYGRSYSIQNLRENSFITREGVSMLGISDAAENIGFRTTGVRISFDHFVEDMTFPCILHWEQSHFVICYGIKKRLQLIIISFFIISPANKMSYLNIRHISCRNALLLLVYNTGLLYNKYQILYL